MKIYKLTTGIGTYYDVVSDVGNGALGTNANGRKWYVMRQSDLPNHPQAFEIGWERLPKSLKKDLENYNIQ